LVGLFLIKKTVSIHAELSDAFAFSACSAVKFGDIENITESFIYPQKNVILKVKNEW
jgi:hypothetical protein